MAYSILVFLRADGPELLPEPARIVDARAEKFKREVRKSIKRDGRCCVGACSVPRAATLAEAKQYARHELQLTLKQFASCKPEVELHEDLAKDPFRPIETFGERLCPKN